MDTRVQIESSVLIIAYDKRVGLILDHDARTQGNLVLRPLGGIEKVQGDQVLLLMEQLAITRNAFERPPIDDSYELCFRLDETKVADLPALLEPTSTDPRETVYNQLVVENRVLPRHDLPDSDYRFKDYGVTEASEVFTEDPSVSLFLHVFKLVPTSSLHYKLIAAARSYGPLARSFRKMRGLPTAQTLYFVRPEDILKGVTEKGLQISTSAKIAYESIR